jgi:site-specific recombinase
MAVADGQRNLTKIENSAMPVKPDLFQLLDSLDPTSDRVHRNLWLIQLLHWIRDDGHTPAQAVGRVDLLLDALQAKPDRMEKFQRLWAATMYRVDASIVLSDYGLASSGAFVSELMDRLQLKWLPISPDTADGGELFGHLFSSTEDPRWIDALPPQTVQRLAEVLTLPPVAAGTTHGSEWENAMVQAVTFCTSHIRAIGFSPEVRARLSEATHLDNPFLQLTSDWDRTVTLWKEGADLSDALAAYKAGLEACRLATQEVEAHLDANGVSVNLVFRLRQLRERILRIRLLLDCIFDNPEHSRTTRLLRQLCLYGQAQLSVRALVKANSSLLAAKVAERSSETGEHYITRNWDEYRSMLRQSAGGGAVLSLTTALKFGIMALGLSAFWYGFWAGVLYAISFVLIQLLHFTVATKQPAMTAPAMAAKLKDVTGPHGVADFVDEVEHLVRSQVASVLGNVALVVPCALLVSVVWAKATGTGVISTEKALYVLHSLDLLGPSLIYAAFTGFLLFSSSLLAGWVENWFVLHKLETAIRFNPRITGALGIVRANRWAKFLRANISGFAANISLGLMLGIVPVVLQFFGLGLDVRHVTLSAGQLSMALATLGTDAFNLPAFWWAVSALPLIGALNVSISFALAYRVALVAHNVAAYDRALIYRTIGQRLLARPMRFFIPPPTHPT